MLKIILQGRLFRNMGFTFLVELFTLIVLWAYAWLCNFAPPILRATIMITITKAGLILRRSSNTYNALFASAFFLLLWDSAFIIQLGVPAFLYGYVGNHLSTPSYKWTNNNKKQFYSEYMDYYISICCCTN